MSPRQRSTLQQRIFSWRVMLLLAVTLIIFAFQPRAVSANGKSLIDGATVLDVLCVEAFVINHEEQPLDDWEVTATYLGSEGNQSPIVAQSNRNGRKRFDLPVPGRWEFSVENRNNWEPVTDATFAVDVVYGAIDCVIIRFKMKQLVPIIILKIDDDHNPLADWVITATPGDDNLFAEPTSATTDMNGLATIYVTPGQWIFTEAAPPDINWWKPISPPDGTQMLDVTAPGPHTIRFKNLLKRGKGCIEVIKRDVPPATAAEGLPSQPFGLPDWPIEILRADGSIAARGQTNAFGEILFTDLPYGPYTVREIMRDGWEPVTPTTYAVVLGRDDTSCQVIEFNNRQAERGFCITGYKRDQNGMYGIAGWEIDATPLNAGGINPEPVLTDGSGKYRIDLPFDDYRVPGSRYEVCEESRNGWTSVGASCYTVTIPHHEGVCVDVPDFVNRQNQNPGNPGNMGHKPNRGPSNGPPAAQREHGGMCAIYHTVKPGESLWKIGTRYGMSVQELTHANAWVRNQRWLYAGQKLCIP